MDDGRIPPGGFRHGDTGKSGGAMTVEHHVGQTIGWAVKQMHNGQKVARRSWHGASHIELVRPLLGEGPITMNYVLHAQVLGGRAPWTCTQDDLLAIDWVFHEALD